MKNDPVYHQWREEISRRKLSAAEQQQLRAWLVSHPHEKEDLEIEASLTEALGSLPQAPVASNFTARVMLAVEREKAAAKRSHESRSWSWWGRFSWRPKAALAAIALSAAWLGGHLIQVAHRAALAQSVNTVTAVAAVPTPDILEDFDAIRTMDKSTEPDNELLALLK